MSTTKQKPADIILQQLGGRNRLRLVGAKDIYSADNGNSLVFKFMRGAKNKATYIKINLDGTDLYNVIFSKIVYKKHPEFNIRIPEQKIVSTHEAIYNDMLVELFESETGLYLSL
jgi:hypothetical protein